MRASRTFALLVLSLALIASRPSTSVPPVNQPVSGPQAALVEMAEGYRALSPDAVVATFTADYRYHAVGDSLHKYLSGATREDEARVVRGLLHGVIRNGDTLLAGADSVGIVIDGFNEGVDPEHPDSTQQYRIVTVGRFEIGFRTRNVRISTPATVHVFHLVRGDVAQLVEGQPADPERWYIRRWLEDISGVRLALGERQGGCGEEPASATGLSSRGRGGAPLPTVLAVRPLTNPACAKLEVTCDLPGREPAHVDVYDVSGRLVNRRDVPVASAGTVTIEAGAGAKLLPGIYWVRLRQAARRPSTRMVAVAK